MNADNFSIPNKMFSGESKDGSIQVGIVGIGGAGSNVADCLSLEIHEFPNISYTVVNTDKAALDSSPIENKCLIGRKVTRGLGTGGDVEFGQQAADKDREVIRNQIGNPDILFIVAGFGGGTGTGAAPVVAEIASSTGALVISFVTLPFTFEGARKKAVTDEGLAQLRKTSDAVIPLPNDILLQGDDSQSSVLKSFAQSKDWVRIGIDAILGLITRTGICNIDYATLRKAFVERGGKTLFSIGSADGENSVAKALESLMVCPLLRTPENALKSDNLIVNITGGADLGMGQVNEIMTYLRENVGGVDNTVFGAVIDENRANNNIEIFILGTTNINRSRKIVGKTPAAEEKPPEDLFPDESDKKQKKKDKKKAKKNAPQPTQDDLLNFGDQEEFDFLESIDANRGFFDLTEKNLYNGEDLDIPTYLRRGIKILIK